MYIEGMLVNKFLVKKALMLFSLILVVGFLILNNQFLLIKRDSSYELINESGKTIPSKVFKFSRDNSARLHIVLKIGSDETNIVIIPDEKLIGLSEGKNTVITLFDNFVLLKKSALIFTPLNEGFNKEISSYEFDNEIIKFSSFKKIQSVGKEIIVIRK